MSKSRVAYALLGSASAVAALAVDGGVASAAAPAVHITGIGIVKAPPSGEYEPPGFPAEGSGQRQTSKMIASYALPQLIKEAMRAQSARIHTISGATATSDAFRRSLASALVKVGQSRTTTIVIGNGYPAVMPGCLGYCPPPLPAYGVVTVKVRGRRA